MINTKIDTKRIKEILATSNAHAIPHLVGKQNKWIKLAWLLCFLISIVFCCYFLNRTIRE